MKMAVYIKVSIIKIKKKDKASIHGLTEKFMTEDGSKANNMERLNLQIQKELQDLVNGRMDNVLSGLKPTGTRQIQASKTDLVL